MPNSSYSPRILTKLTEQSTPDPWNPDEPIQITPEEYEDQVCSWLSQASKANANDIVWTSRKVIEGQGGDYEIDVVGEMSLLEGSQIRILVECKRWRRPVNREIVLAHAKKLERTASHKGMIFSTSGFQRGALEAAEVEGIATLIFVDGKVTYQTRALGSRREPPEWITLPKYAALLMSVGCNSIRTNQVTSDHVTPITEWIRKNMPS